MEFKKVLPSWMRMRTGIREVHQVTMLGKPGTSYRKTSIKLGKILRPLGNDSAKSSSFSDFASPRQHIQTEMVRVPMADVSLRTKSQKRLGSCRYNLYIYETLSWHLTSNTLTWPAMWWFWMRAGKLFGIKQMLVIYDEPGQNLRWIL